MHFSHFLNQFFKRKELENENQAFNALFHTANQEKESNERALDLLNKIDQLIHKAKKKAFKDMIKSVYSDKLKDMMLNRMMKNLQTHTHELDLKDGLDALLSNAKKANDKHAKLSDLIKKLV